jgi:hypothetical protein
MFTYGLTTHPDLLPTMGTCDGSRGPWREEISPTTASHTRYDNGQGTKGVCASGNASRTARSAIPTRRLIQANYGMSRFLDRYRGPNENFVLATTRQAATLMPTAATS